MTDWISKQVLVAACLPGILEHALGAGVQAFTVMVEATASSKA